MIRLILNLSSPIGKEDVILTSPINFELKTESIFDYDYEIQSSIDRTLKCTSAFDIEPTFEEDNGGG